MSARFLKLLTVQPDTIKNDEIVYSLDEIKEKSTQVVDLEQGCYLALFQKEDHWLEFALFHFYCSDCDYNNITVNCVFSGEGTGTLKEGEFALREMRHIWWGEEGYTFYLPGKAVIQALQHLQKYFDMD